MNLIGERGKSFFSLIVIFLSFEALSETFRSSPNVRDDLLSSAASLSIFVLFWSSMLPCSWIQVVAIDYCYTFQENSDVKNVPERSMGLATAWHYSQLLRVYILKKIYITSPSLLQGGIRSHVC